MSEEEMLGKLAYDAYHNAWKANGLRLVQIGWYQLAPTDQRPWIAVGKAVATQVLLEMQAANEASGA